jgi:four helix bundle protein
MRDYKKLEVWKKAHELYLHTKQVIAPNLPQQERFEILPQMQRAALSIPLNIAEGSGRNSNKDFAHFLHIALGSLNELEYCLLRIKIY